MTEIVRLDEDRWNDYRRLRLEALARDSAAFGSSYEEEHELGEEIWRSRIGHMLFAESDGRLIGMIAVVRETKRKLLHIASIYSVYVDRNFRGRGIGQELLEAALAVIQQMDGVIKIKLAVNPEQMSAVQLYQRNGFETVGRLRKELMVGGTWHDELLMERLL